jgi:hypothetical protein
MSRLACLLLLINSFFVYAQNENFIVYTDFEKLNEHEFFSSGERIINQDGENYRYIVEVESEGIIKKAFEFKNAYNLIMFDDKRRFLLYLNPNTYACDGGSPLYYIDGNTGTIESLGLFTHGFFVVEDKMVIINRISKDRNYFLTEDLFVYSITDKKVISTYNVNEYLSAIVYREDRDYYLLGFPDYKEGRNIIRNGRIRVYFDHYGEDGPKSFYAYLNINDVYNIFMEPPVDGTSRVITLNDRV